MANLSAFTTIEHIFQNRLKRLSRFKFFILNRLMSILPLKQNRVLFFSDQRAKLGGNLKCLYDRIDDIEYDKQVILRANTFIKRTQKEELRLIYQLSTSKYVLLDDWNLPTTLMRRRRGQEVVQLWHGSGAFKTFGYTRLDRNATMDKFSGHRNYTKAIVTAESIRWCYAEGFGIGVESVKATGSPRTDCFFDENYKNSVKEAFYKKYPQFEGKKIVIFAPTYRGNNLKNCYYDFEMLDSQMIEKQLGDDYVFIIKWHPAIYDKMVIDELFYDIEENNKVVIDFSAERDINDLLLVCDLLVTDYSSVIFDYCLLDKPIVYYVYDLARYKRKRGLYFDFEEYVYGPCAASMDELIECIKNAKVDCEKHEAFRERFMEACFGKSTENTYDYVFNQ